MREIFSQQSWCVVLLLQKGFEVIGANGIFTCTIVATLCGQERDQPCGCRNQLTGVCCCSARIGKRANQQVRRVDRACRSLRASARALDDGTSLYIGSDHERRGVVEVKTGYQASANLSGQQRLWFSLAQGERLVCRAYQPETPRSAREGVGGDGEGANYINDNHNAARFSSSGAIDTANI